MSRRPFESRAPRNMPSELNSSAMLPSRSTTITPPSPPIRLSVPCTASRAASSAESPRYFISELISWPSTVRMKYSPLPVAETAQEALSA